MRGRPLLAVLVLAALLAFALPVPALELLLPDGRTVQVEVKTFDGAGWICLDHLAKAVGGSAGRDPLSRYPTWTFGKHRVLFSTATAMTSVDGKLLNTGRAAKEREGCVYVPDTFLEIGLPVVLDGPVRAQGAAAPAPPTPPAPKVAPEAPPPTPQTVEGADVTVETTVASDTVRVTVSGTGVSGAKVRKEGDVLVLPLPRGRAEFSPVEMGSGIALRLEAVDGGRALRLQLGTGYVSHETESQRNPERLTLVVKGSGQLPPAPAAAGVLPDATAGPRPAKVPGQFLVVVDPGHGGSDTGALSKGGLQEKEIALAIAQKVAAALRAAGMRALLTREGDTFIPLTQRTALANYNRADVLLSIHLNASPAASAKGAETYFMSREATDLWSRQLAEKENSSGGAAAGSDTLSLVLWNLAQTQSIVESAALAEAIQERLNGLLETKERGVRQAPFVVLEGAQMPAVLVEVAFLSNPSEAEQLQDAAFQSRVAEALAASVADFKARNDAPPPAP